MDRSANVRRFATDIRRSNTVRRMPAMLVAGAIGALVATGSADAATNLLVNGSFEAGTLAGWSYTALGANAQPGRYPASVIVYGSRQAYPYSAWGEAVAPAYTLSKSPDPAGSRALYFVADGVTETISQKVYLTPGRYSAGYSVYLPANGYRNKYTSRLTASFAGSAVPVFDAKTFSAQRWKDVQTDFTITQAGYYPVSLQYQSIASQAADIVVDRVFLIAVPEPAAWSLMILGFGAAGAVLRAKRRVRAT